MAPSWEISPGQNGIDWIYISGTPWGSDVLELEFLIPGDYVITMTVNSEACGGSVVGDTITVVEPPEVFIDIDVATGSNGNARKLCSGKCNFYK